MNSFEQTNPFENRMTQVVRLILIITAVSYVLQVLIDRFAGDFYTNAFGFQTNILKTFYLWQPVTYMFLHGGPFHLLINMLMFYLFGCEMEEVLGSKRFFRLYFVSGIIGGVAWFAANCLSGGEFPCVGASGAIFGVMGSFAAIFPDRRVSLMFIPIFFRVRTLAIAFAAIALLGMISSDGNVAHSAHLFGGLFGYFFARRYARRPILLDQMIYPDKGASGVVSNIKAHLRRKKMHVVTDDYVPTGQEVDRILEKITESGKESLSKRELRILARASDGGTKD